MFDKCVYTGPLSEETRVFTQSLFPYLGLQASEEVSKCLVAMKEILYGTNDKEPHTETVAQLAQELYNSGLLISLVENLQVIDFEVSPPPPNPGPADMTSPHADMDLSNVPQ